MIWRLILRASLSVMMGMILGIFSVILWAVLSRLLSGEQGVADWQTRLIEHRQELFSLLLQAIQHGFPGSRLLYHGLAYSLSLLSQAMPPAGTGWFVTQTSLHALMPYITVLEIGLQWVTLCLGWFLLSLPLVIMGMIIAAVDGWVDRLRRRYQGGRESAHRHQHAVQTMQASLLLGIWVFMVWPLFFKCSCWHLLWLMVLVGSVCLQRTISSDKKYQ